MDRGYLDFARLYALHQSGGFFVTRAKRNTNIRRIASRAIDRSTGLICDQSVMLNTFYVARDYPGPLRRIRYRDPTTHKSLVFLTNHFGIPALSVCALYKSRWSVELFFKWIKQHLRIKRFFGTSENAVKSQVWIAVSTYVLVAIARKRLNVDLSLHTMLQVLSVTPFEKIPLFQLFSDTDEDPNMPRDDNQLNLL
jgi:Transposase DDE domain